MTDHRFVDDDGKPINILEGEPPVLFIDEGVVHLCFYFNRYRSLCQRSFGEKYVQHKRSWDLVPTCLICLAKRD